jgi:hypothetical protein
MNKVAPRAHDLFAKFPHSPAEHFRLHFFGAVLVCLDYEVSCAASVDAVLARFPFLIGYNNELAGLVEGISSEEAFQQWTSALEEWEGNTAVHLPLRALRQLLGVGPVGVMCLLTAELPDEDARFGTLFESHQNPAGQRRCTLGLLRSMWRAHLDAADFSLLWRQARNLGVAQAVNPDAANPEVAVQIPSAVWANLRGDSSGALVSWARYRPRDELSDVSDLILPAEILATIRVAPAVFATGTTSAIVVRGATHNGRRTLLGALAREMGKGTLELKLTESVDEARWREFATLAALTNALPIVALDLAPGETRALPDDWPRTAPLGIAMRSAGAISGEVAAQAVTLTLDSPDICAREQHWARALPSMSVTDRNQISSRYRLPAGQIHRAAGRAQIRATLAGRSEVTPADVADALRSINRQNLDALARRCTAEGDWSQLCTSPQTFRELEHLENHCRHRERLPNLLDSERTMGVRALFSGPSGTGKTHAARLLAAALQKDLYQLNLAEVVNKYIGETEKNLGRVLEAAEDLDVILLIDEGDALLTQRTDVHSSNDRFGNMQTNFLLQRLDRYQGILIVTTNARTRIDTAFERRMDVTVEFHAPDTAERWSLWQLHLPSHHSINSEFVEELAARCELTGGQIRNAALHASLLALNNGGIVTTAYLEAAARREYAKIGGVCPLRHVTEIT